MPVGAPGLPARSLSLMSSTARLSRIAFGATLLLVAVGGFTRGSGSGYGCSDRWPLCENGLLGGLLPRLEYHMVVEWTHRWVAAVVGLLILATAVSVWRYYRTQAAVVRLAVTAVVVVVIQAYRLLVNRMEAEGMNYPLHLGVTEAGPAFQGTIKSATAFGALLSQGIGDTIRVSLSAPPVEEVKVGIQILESLNLKPRRLEIVSCPSCGRAQVDVYKLADEVTAGLDGLEVPLRVAVMGCVVNGPGEAREADLGVASGNGKGQIFVKGEVIKTVPESKIVETLIEEAMRIAEGMEAVDGGSAEVTVG